MWPWVVLPPAITVAACIWRHRLPFWVALLATSILFSGVTLGLIDADQTFAPPWLWRLAFFIFGPWFAPLSVFSNTSRIAPAFWGALLLQVFADVPMAELGAAIILVFSNRPRVSFIYLPSLAICALLRYATCDHAFFYTAYILHHVWILLCIYAPSLYN